MINVELAQKVALLQVQGKGVHSFDRQRFSEAAPAFFALFGRHGQALTRIAHISPGDRESRSHVTHGGHLTELHLALFQIVVGLPRGYEIFTDFVSRERGPEHPQ